MKVLLIDAYDSFVHIIDQYLRTSGPTPTSYGPAPVPRGTRRHPPRRGRSRPRPRAPRDSGHVELVHRFAGRVPVLGVCLGHQAIALAYGGRVEVADQIMHGRISTVRHDGAGIYQGLGHTLEATRYHSLVVAESLPRELTVTAVAADHGYVMGLRHRTLAVEGVQFHPESIMTTAGLTLLENFLATSGSPAPGREAGLTGARPR